MSREVREVRPYDVGASLSGVLDQARVWFGNDECEPGGRVDIDDPFDLRLRRVELIWASESEFGSFIDRLRAGPEELGIDPSDLALLITAYTSYLKITDEVFRHPLSNLDQLSRQEILSDPRPDALRAGVHGFTVVAYLLLTSNITPEPLRPWRKGTWLDRATFRFRAHSVDTLFRPMPLDEEHRTRLRLPKGTVRYLELENHDPLRPYYNSDPPTFWVDKRLLAALDTRSRTRQSRSIQIQLVQDFIWGVVVSPAVQRKVLDDMDWQDLRESLLGRVVKFVAGTRADERACHSMVKLVRSDPAAFMARVEAAIGLHRVLIKNLDEE